MRVAIVHEWLTIYGGSERVVEQILKLFPEADIFTTVYNEKNMARFFPPEKVHASFMQKIPFSGKFYTKMLSLMPRAFESFDLSDYDLVISSSSSCAKGVITRADTLHISYVHTPMRYAWDLYHDYMKSSGFITRTAMKKTMHRIRQWDALSAMRVDYFIANSNLVKRRILKVYRREAEVIHPPVDTDFFEPNGKEAEEFFLILSRLIPYKRIDLAIKSCNELKRKLVIIGAGPLEKDLKKIASPTVEFKGRLSDSESRDYYQRCKAFLFPGFEDFGITPLEAQACGRPVIAYGSGGVLDSIEDGKTGVFFTEQTVSSMKEGILRFENMVFDSAAIRKHAERFSNYEFRNRLDSFIRSRNTEK
ncbi:MAG: glycosyltransferase [Spirochaetales bacterium]|nr:glycosyltransferase [Spirochaetales bacterium]